MTVDERQVRDALRVSVTALGMTSRDVERMQKDLQGRLGQGQLSPRRRGRLSRRRPWVAAVAALAVAAAVVGALWVRRPQPPPPQLTTGVPLAAEIVGVWHSNSSLSMVFHADSTARFFTVAEGVLFPPGTYQTGPGEVISEKARFRVSGDTLVMSMQDATARSCEYTFTATRLGDGRVDLTPVSQIGPGCVTDALSSPFTMVRISPASPAGLDLSVAADSELTPVTGTNPLYGVWLLKGTGTLLAVDSTGVSAAVPYRIDHNGTIDTAPDDSGGLTVPAAGQVVLKGIAPTTCGDTTLKSVSAGDYSFTATVVTDPCNRFGGQPSLLWLRIQ